MTKVDKVSLWIEKFGEKITENKEHLNSLDTAIGDGDHGSNLTRGATAVKEQAEGADYDNLSDLFKDVGMTLVSKVGGASGPLYGSAFIEMAKKARETDDIGEILSAGLRWHSKTWKSRYRRKNNGR
jgi:dihydroxyacetone kinase-like protein